MPMLAETTIGMAPMLSGSCTAARIFCATTDSVLGMAQLGEDDRELVAAEAGHGVVVAHALAQPARHLQQQLVAGGVAERVVDGLEVIDVDEHHRHGAAVALGAREAVAQPIGEQLAVRQVREDVVVGVELDLFLGALPVADVDDRGVDDAGDGVADEHEILRAPTATRSSARRSSTSTLLSVPTLRRSVVSSSASLAFAYSDAVERPTSSARRKPSIAAKVVLQSTIAAVEPADA